MLPKLISDTRKPPIVINVIRIHAYKSGILNLVHVDKKDAKKRRLELLQDGYTIAHSELL